MSERDGALATAQREAERLHLQGLQRRRWGLLMWSMVGCVSGLLLLYWQAGWPPAVVILIAFSASMFYVLWITRRLARKGGLSPLWMLSRQDRRTVQRALRGAGPVADPRLASAAIESIRMSEHIRRPMRSVAAPVLGIGSMLFFWVVSIPRYGLINVGLLLLAGSLLTASQILAMDRRARRASRPRQMKSRQPPPAGT